jgi:hypothetical protein
MSVDKDGERSRAHYFADGTRRIQRNFGLPEETAEWLRVVSFKTQRSQSALAREAFDDLKLKYEQQGISAAL